MTEHHFEWDDDKAASNGRKHDVTFVDAAMAFDDLFFVELVDGRENYGEQRINLLGMVEGTLLHVTYTERGQNIRIISARRAKRHEQDHYFRENSG